MQLLSLPLTIKTSQRTQYARQCSCSTNVFVAYFVAWWDL